MSWERPNLLPIWEAQVCHFIGKRQSHNAISADRLLAVRGLFQRCSGQAHSFLFA